MSNRTLIAFSLGAILTSTTYAQEEQSSAASTDKPVWSVMSTEGHVPDDSNLDDKVLPMIDWQPKRMVRPFLGLGLGLSLGSDQLSVPANNNTSRATIDAGQYINAYTGLFIAIPTTMFQTKITLGYMSNSSNGNVFTRYPLSITPTWEFKRHRFGLGLTYHMSPTFDTKNTDTEFKYKSKVGTVVEYDYKITEGFAVGVSAVNIKYNNDNANKAINDAKGSSASINLSYTF